MPRKKQWMMKGGLTREDSDDELGSDDIPWQWIHDNEDDHHAQSPDTTSRGRSDLELRSTESSPDPIQSPVVSKKRKVQDVTTDQEQISIQRSVKKRRGATTAAIIGARIGSFVIKVGDAVLLKSPEAGKDWAGLIAGFSDVNEDGDSEMCAHIMWFCSPDELESSSTSTARNRQRNLPDTFSNESYITADFNMNPLTAINGRARILGHKAFLKEFPGGAMPRAKAARKLFGKSILCRRGVKQRNMRFTDEFEWSELYQGPSDLLGLLDWIRENTKGGVRRIKPTEKTAERDEEVQARRGVSEVDGDITSKNMPATPSKKRKGITATAATPKSSVKSTKFVTPTSKRIMIKKPLEFTPLGTRILSPYLNANTGVPSPFAAARSTLHVSAVPTALPCRDSEFAAVYSHLHSAIMDGSGTCIYISGTPGTGKTATVREVVASLHNAVQNDELDDFHFVEINGMKVTEPAQSYSLLWEALKGDRVSPTNALSLLEHEFSNPSPRRIPCVVLMDELDQLVTKSQSVMYNFFNWPNLRHSRLIVLAVANTMDLPERTLSNKISSRLGLTRITFSGYTHQQLMQIIESRLAGVGVSVGKEEGIVDEDAIQFAARKVAAVSGDARRALDICRRAVEIAEQEAKDKPVDIMEVDPMTPSKTGRGKKAGKSDSSRKGQPRVSIATIKQAINEATSSPFAQHLRSLPLSSKLFLAALLARSRRTGVNESTFGDVLAESKRIANVSENSAIHDFLLTDQDIGVSKGQQVPQVLAMGAAAMELVEAGIIAMDMRARGERSGKVRLRIGEDEVKSSLMTDNEAAGMGFNA